MATVPVGTTQAHAILAWHAYYPCKLIDSAAAAQVNCCPLPVPQMYRLYRGCDSLGGGVPRMMEGVGISACQVEYVEAGRAWVDPSDSLFLEIQIFFGPKGK